MPLPKLSFLRGVDPAFIGEDDDALSDHGDDLFLGEAPFSGTLLLAGLLPEFPEFSGTDLAGFPEFSSCACSSLLLDLASMTARIAGVSGDGVKFRHLKSKMGGQYFTREIN